MTEREKVIIMEVVSYKNLEYKSNLVEVEVTYDMLENAVLWNFDSKYFSNFKKILCVENMRVYIIFNYTFRMNCLAYFYCY